MSRRLICACIAAGGFTMAGSVVAARDTPDVAYQKLIAGKVPERPVDCINSRSDEARLSAYGDKLIYQIDRKLVYVNQTTGGCERVARGDALVSTRVQTRICRGDIARTVDLVNRVPTGSCALGSFTPYRAH